MDFNAFETDPTAPVTAPSGILVPSDGANLTLPIRGFHVGGAGNVRVTAPNGVDVIYYGLQAGQTYPYCAVKLWATGTTATNIVGFTS